MNDHAKRIIELDARVAALSMSNQEMTKEAVEMMVLIELEMKKLTLLLSNKHRIIASIKSMKELTPMMIRLSALFSGYEHKNEPVIRTTSLDQLPSTLADLENVEEHSEEFEFQPSFSHPVTER